jgi:hypothetical protein
VSHTPPIPRNRRRIIGPLLLGAAGLLASCDKITEPNAIHPPGEAQASGGATALGSATLGHGASNVSVGAAPANTWVVVRISGGLTPRQNPECLAAATPYWACPTSMTIPPFDPKPYPSGPVEIWRSYGTSQSRMTVRAGGGGAIGLFRTSSPASISATVNVSVPNWYMPGANPIPAFFLDGSYTVTTEAIPNPLSLTEGAPGTGGTRQYSLATMYGLQFMNPTDPYYFAYYPTPFVSWRFIPGSNVSDTPSGEAGVNVSACANMVTCSYTPAGPGRMEASAYVEGREVKVRSVPAPIDPCAGTAASGVSLDCAETPPSLTVTCTPTPVERGGTVRCTGIVAPAAQMTVIRLTARGAGFSNTETPNTVVAAGDSAVWSGTAVAASQVRFVAQVAQPGGTTTIQGNGTFAVSARTWAPYQLTTAPPSTTTLQPGMQPYPSNGVLGSFSPHGLNPYVAPIDSVASGPNAGLMYYTERPPYISSGASVAMHPALYPPATHPATQQWYNDQNGSPSGTCTQAEVPLLRAEAERHEGLTQAANSHYGVANQAFLTHRPDRTLEALYLFRVPKDRVHLRAYRVYRNFVTGPSHAMQQAFDTSDYPLILAKFSCQFDFNQADS